jgi:hypothetical protein
LGVVADADSTPARLGDEGAVGGGKGGADARQPRNTNVLGKEDVAKIVVDGVKYDMPDNFTYREMNRIKRLTGLRAGELFPALEAGDTDVALAFAITAADRAGLLENEEQFMDLELDKIELDFSDEEEKAGPPAEPAAAEEDEPAASVA